MAGHRIYSFDWAVFSDLTSNTESAIPSALAEAILDAKTRPKLGLPSKLPKAPEKLASLIRDLFLRPEWYAGQPIFDVNLRHQLLLEMLFGKALKSIGLSAAPSWRDFCECCSFDLACVFAGRFALNLERTTDKHVFYRIVEKPAPGQNEFWWLGQRPYRYATWQATNKEQFVFEEKYEHALYSIHSPDDANMLACKLEEEFDRCKPIKCKELQELFSDYQHCINGVKQKNAVMFVENDT